MDKTQPLNWINKPCEGYVMNAVFSEKNAAKVMELINVIVKEYGDSVFCMPKDSLHITLLDWIAPLVEYGSRDKKELFQGIYDEYDGVLSDAIGNEESFTVTFDTIHVAPTTIFISGYDNGQFERIRSKYLDSVELLPNTKLPPTIIHSSLVRFTEELDLDRVNAFIDKQTITVHQIIDEFRLVHTFREPMLEFEVLKTYSLDH